MDRSQHREPELFNFKNKHKDDPVANGELQEIPGGVRRPAELQQSKVDWTKTKVHTYGPL
jgi:hypothetical protein